MSELAGGVLMVLELGLLESLVPGIGVVVVLSVVDGDVVVLGEVVLGEVGWAPIDGCWSLGVVVVVCAMLRPAAATVAITAAMLNVLNVFLMSLTPVPVGGFQ